MLSNDSFTFCESLFDLFYHALEALKCLIKTLSSCQLGGISLALRRILLYLLPSLLVHNARFFVDILVPTVWQGFLFFDLVISVEV